MQYNTHYRKYGTFFDYFIFLDTKIGNITELYSLVPKSRNVLRNDGYRHYIFVD
jgi:hypothetical protein